MKVSYDSSRTAAKPSPARKGGTPSRGKSTVVGKTHPSPAMHGTNHGTGRDSCNLGSFKHRRCGHGKK